MPASHLPSQRTPFVGRQDELAQLDALLADPACRLLSLVGPGGMGKTRLAVEIARRASFTDGVYFAALQSLSSPEYLVPALAEAVSFQLRQDEDPWQQFLDHVREKSMLLVLDNFEHLLEGASLVSDLLAGGPGLKVLVTSREALNLQEEWLYPVSALRVPADVPADVPAGEGGVKADDYSAVQLFIQCARRVRADFVWDKEQAGVIRICRLVGGMPLGIELASGWVRALTCAEIADEIECSLDILETPARNVLPRHRTLRAVLEPTWDRLTDTERAVFMQLSVFRGGFRKEAAQAVANASLHTLSALVDKSLVQHDTHGRYDLHELLRQYAAERLDQAGATPAAQAAHGAYYLSFLAHRTPDLKGQRQLGALNEIDAEFDNVRAAWLWAAAHRQPEAIRYAMDSLRMFCEWRSRFREGEDLFRQAQTAFVSSETGGSPLPVWGSLTACRAWLLLLGEIPLPVDLPAQMEQALTAARACQDRAGTAFCQLVLGILALQSNDTTRSLSLLGDSLAFYREIDDRFFMSAILDWLGHLKISLIDALPLFEEGLELSRETGALDVTAWILSGIGFTRLSTGELDRARACFQESLAIQRSRGDWKGIVLNTSYLGRAAFFSGEYEKAQALAADTRQLAADHPIYTGQKAALALRVLLSAVWEEDYPQTRQQCAEAFAMRETLFDWDFWLSVNLGLAICACGEQDYTAAGQHLQAVLALAIPRHVLLFITACLPIQAMILAHDRQPAQAAECLGLAFAQASRPHIWLEHWPLLTRLRARLETQMGSAAYHAAWERGAALDLYDTAQALIAVQPPAERPAQGISEPLTGREIEILRLAAAGLSNRAIARQVILSLGTVKWYLHQIYGKLYVTNRTQAVTRARELKLLP